MGMESDSMTGRPQNLILILLEVRLAVVVLQLADGGIGGGVHDPAGLTAETLLQGVLQADQLIIGDRSGRRGGHSAGCGLNAGDLAGSAVDKLTLQLFGHGFSYLVDNKVHHIDVRVVLQLVGYQGQCTNHEDRSGRWW